MGPFRVQSIKRKKAELKDLVTGKRIRAHVEHIRPYHVRSEMYLTDDALESIAALSSSSHFEVSQIIEKKVKPSSRRKNSTSLRPDDYEYLTRWTGYDGTFDTWQSHYSVKDTTAYAKFMQP